MNSLTRQRDYIFVQVQFIVADELRSDEKRRKLLLQKFLPDWLLLRCFICSYNKLQKMYQIWFYINYYSIFLLGVQKSSEL